jgi:hypothetical protein
VELNAMHPAQLMYHTSIPLFPVCLILKCKKFIMVLQKHVKNTLLINKTCQENGKYFWFHDKWRRICLLFSNKCKLKKIIFQNLVFEK